LYVVKTGTLNDSLRGIIPKMAKYKTHVLLAENNKIFPINPRNVPKRKEYRIPKRSITNPIKNPYPEISAPKTPYIMPAVWSEKTEFCSEIKRHQH